MAPLSKYPGKGSLGGPGVHQGVSHVEQNSFYHFSRSPFFHFPFHSAFSIFIFIICSKRPFCKKLIVLIKGKEIS